MILPNRSRYTCEPAPLSSDLGMSSSRRPRAHITVSRRSISCRTAAAAFGDVIANASSFLAGAARSCSCVCTYMSVRILVRVRVRARVRVRVNVRAVRVCMQALAYQRVPVSSVRVHVLVRMSVPTSVCIHLGAVFSQRHQCGHIASNRSFARSSGQQRCARRGGCGALRGRWLRQRQLQKREELCAEFVPMHALTQRQAKLTHPEAPRVLVLHSAVHQNAVKLPVDVEERRPPQRVRVPAIEQNHLCNITLAYVLFLVYVSLVYNS